MKIICLKRIFHIIKIKSFFLFSILVITSTQIKSYSQTSSNSGFQHIDTALINRQISEAEQINKTNPDKAKALAQKTLSDADKIQYLTGKQKATYLISKIEHNKGNFKIAAKHLNTYIKTKEINNDTAGLASAYNNLGLTLAKDGQYTTAIYYLTKGFKLFNSVHFKRGMTSSLINMGLIYGETQRYNEAIQYFNKALEIKKEMKDSIGIVKILSNIGATYIEKKDFQKANKYFNEALLFLPKSTDLEIISTLNGNIGSSHYEAGNIEQAKQFLIDAIDAKQKSGNKDGLANLENTLANVYFKNKNYIKVEALLNSSLELSKEMNDKKVMAKNYHSLSNVYESLGRFEIAFHYLKLYSSLNDSLTERNLSQKLVKLQVEFENERQLFEISNLTHEKDVQLLKVKESRYLLVGSIGFTLLIIISGIIFFIRYRSRQRIKEQIVMQKKLLAHTLETEERERKRFAEELHDGIGPLLSGIKLCMEESGNEKLDVSQKAEVQQHTNEMITQAISSIKEISNNMMPHILENYGLLNALNSFCNKLSKFNNTNIDISKIKQNQPYSKIIDIIIYRVITELINNSLKHAHSKNIVISLHETNGYIFIDYTDDGIGCSIDIVLNKNEKGFGLKNIQNRIHSIQGEINFVSSIGNGFQMKCKIPINNAHP